MIVDHVAGNSRLWFARSNYSPYEYNDLLIPLLWVCHNFRFFVHARFCKHYKLTLSARRKIELSSHRYSWPSCRRDRRDLGYSTHHLARELDVYLDIPTVLNGQAFQLLLDSPYTGGAFPSVRKVSFELDYDLYEFSSDSDNDHAPGTSSEGASATSDDDTSANGDDLAWDNGDDHAWDNGCGSGDNGAWNADDDQRPESDGDHDDHAQGNSDSSLSESVKAYVLELTTNIAVFVNQVKQVVPSVREVEVALGYEAERDFGRSSTERDLALQLFGIVENTTVITRGCDLFVKYADLEPIRDLVHIECGIVGPSQAIISLTRRSAQTLQLLRIWFRRDADIVGLIRDTNSSNYMEYPCLRKLELSSDDDITPSISSVFSGAVPFPCLRQLGINCNYPFADDVLFRGNSATLEFLKVSPHPATVAVLKRHNLFTPTSHPKLQRVDIGALPSLAPGHFPDIGTYLRFVLRIAPGASVRVIPNLPSNNNDLSPALSMFGDHLRIQVLSMPGTLLSLWDIISLIKSLPLLSDLSTLPVVLGEMPQGITMAELPAYVRATYPSMGKRFRCWHWEYYYGQPDYAKLTTCMLLLALVCPNFDYAAVHAYHREEFMEAMRVQIAEPGFNQDAPRLRRLLFDGWRG
ncbi:hypothetical protein IWW47_000296 [Coemansia sp. RSA 2052]|nr:hypothetical protein IWW47_000296 [Coemansia sp. RSA 2052]